MLPTFRESHFAAPPSIAAPTGVSRNPPTGPRTTRAIQRARAKYQKKRAQRSLTNLAVGGAIGFILLAGVVLTIFLLDQDIPAPEGSAAYAPPKDSADEMQASKSNTLSPAARIARLDEVIAEIVQSQSADLEDLSICIPKDGGDAAMTTFSNNFGTGKLAKRTKWRFEDFEKGLCAFGKHSEAGLTLRFKKGRIPVSVLGEQLGARVVADQEVLTSFAPGAPPLNVEWWQYDHVSFGVNNNEVRAMQIDCCAFRESRRVKPQGRSTKPIGFAQSAPKEGRRDPLTLAKPGPKRPTNTQINEVLHEIMQSATVYAASGKNYGGEGIEKAFVQTLCNHFGRTERKRETAKDVEQLDNVLFSSGARSLFVRLYLHSCEITEKDITTRLGPPKKTSVEKIDVLTSADCSPLHTTDELHLDMKTAEYDSVHKAAVTYVVRAGSATGLRQRMATIKWLWYGHDLRIGVSNSNGAVRVVQK